MASSSSTPPLLPPPIIRQIWGVKAKEEFQLIENSLDEHPYVSIDTEFPGCIVQVQSYMQLKPQNRYELMKSNVDSTKLIQLGITLTNESGELPKFSGSNSGCIWVVYLSDFDITKDNYAEASIKLLQENGFNFGQIRSFGVRGTVLANLLVSSGIVGPENNVKAYVLFQGAYDLGYLVKLLSATVLPSTLKKFLIELKKWFGKFYDVKYITKKHQIHGGLERIATLLDLEREVREMHDAGSDSLLTWRAFQKIRQMFYGDDASKMEVDAGILASYNEEGWDAAV